MTEKKISVFFFRNKNGEEPVKSWLKSLNPEEKKKIGEDIKTVEYGWPIGMPVCRRLGKKLYEVRSQLPTKKVARVIFCVIGKDMILLHGFIKKTQKTPTQDLDLARSRKKEVDLDRDNKK